MLSVRDMLLLFLVTVEALWGVSGLCDKSNAELLNGVESRPDPFTVMTSSSQKDFQHAAVHGLPFGKNGWSPAPGVKDAWLEADLGTMAYISRVIVFSKTGLVHLNVGTSLDLKDWDYAPKIQSRGLTMMAAFKQPIEARYVRITVNKPKAATELEMLVIGCKRRRGVAIEHRLFGRMEPS